MGDSNASEELPSQMWGEAIWMAGAILIAVYSFSQFRDDIAYLLLGFGIAGLFAVVAVLIYLVDFEHVDGWIDRRREGNGNRPSR